MRSTTWLSTASATVVCAFALASSIGAAPSAHAPAEELHYDAAGNLHWSDDVQASASVASLGRPDFSSSTEKVFGASVQAQVEDALEQAVEGIEHLVDEAEEELAKLKHKLGKEIKSARKSANEWINAGKVWAEGIEYDRVLHPAFPEYTLRLSTSDKQLCDPNVKQHSGYLDISDTKHLFFWFFESRSKPKDDPLVLWLNGGPGCSSSTGLLFELGPCNIAKNGTTTEPNPHSWNSNTNMIFLDQPVEVGYSYADGESINNTPAAAEDVYAFLQLFMAKFPEYASLPFHVAAESYGGHYAPHIGDRIHHYNKKAARGERIHASKAEDALSPVHVNLESLMIGNGLTNPLVQFASVPEYACSGKYAMFDPNSSTCQSLEQKSNTCHGLISNCNKYNSRLTCTPAALYCWSQLYGPAQQSGLNLYDVRKKCDRSEDKDGPLCYKEMGWVETYLNQPDVKRQLGIAPSLDFQSCNMQVNQAFMFQGDGMHNSAELLPSMIEDGIRVLIYAGEADFMCNAVGNKAWLTELETSYQPEFANATDAPWTVDGRDAGYVKQAGSGAGNVAYVLVKDAGHMVPHDQPEAALDLINRWVSNKSLAM